MIAKVKPQRDGADGRDGAQPSGRSDRDPVADPGDDCAARGDGVARDDGLVGVRPGDHIAVRGALRRRFARSAGGPTSWFTVEVAAVEPFGECCARDRPS